MDEATLCPVCSKGVKANKDGSLRTHKEGDEYCSGGRKPGPKTPEDKAQRYIDEGRVTIVRREETPTGLECEIKVQGSEADPYTVRLSGGLWTCDCPAHVWRCAHVIAGQIVAKREVPKPSLGTSLDEFLLGAEDEDILNGYMEVE